jgi:tRNA threonylcarbamoyl adenosine modification protein (Sua5/YciO/YrdC/YwlC family)
MILYIHPENPEPRKMNQIVNTLKKGGVIIYPTDTVYGLGCDIYNSSAIEKLCHIKGISPKNSNLSILCHDFSELANFTIPIENHIFRVMKKALPGPYTFILKANHNVPKIFHNRKKSVGIRIPNHNVPREIVRMLGNPIVTTSIHADDKIVDYMTDPELIHEKYEKLVDIVVASEFGGKIPSTIIDCSDGDFEVVREGAGSSEILFT